MKRHRRELLMGLTGLLLTACFEMKEYPLHFQFAQEDLDCLLSNNLDSFILFTNTPYLEYDTAYYLRNGIDTVGERVETSIYSQCITFGFEFQDNFINGYSAIEFDNCPFLESAEFRMGMWSSESHPDWAVRIYAARNEVDSLNRYIGVNLKALDSTYIDTANVLGVNYDHTYKIYIRKDYPSRFISLFYRSGYGFLKIEMRDGQKIELIGYKKLKLRPLTH